jgi:uncharacterized protein (DUF736 family)
MIKIMENNSDNSVNGKNPKKRKELGALWIRKSKQGNSFLSGSLSFEGGGTAKVVVFKNTYKEAGSSQPDYRIYLDESVPAATQSESKAPEAQTEDEIPF